MPCCGYCGVVEMYIDVLDMHWGEEVRWGTYEMWTLNSNSLSLLTSPATNFTLVNVSNSCSMDMQLIYDGVNKLCSHARDLVYLTALRCVRMSCAALRVLSHGGIRRTPLPARYHTIHQVLHNSITTISSYLPHKFSCHHQPISPPSQCA